MKWFEKPGLAFALGMEDTFIPQEALGKRKLDEYEATQHDHYWYQDLGLAAEAGASMVRWGIPWYRINPGPDTWDFSWLDRVVDRFQELQLTPIVDLMHYGTPLWLENEFANPHYPERIAEYAAKVAERYRGALDVFTPLNEPVLNIVYCGEDAEWPPYLRGDDGFVTILERIARGIVLTQNAIAEVNPDASFVHVEAGYRFTDPTGSHRERVEFLKQRVFIVEDLLHGMVGDDHPLHDWLLHNGFPESSLEWHRIHRAEPDVMGVNYYPLVSTELFEAEGTPAGTVRDPRRRVNEWTDGMEDLLRTFADRYRKPVMLTETCATGAEADRIAWLDASVQHVYDLQANGLPIVGYCWWAVIDWIEWSYRNENRPLLEYFDNGGLWHLEPDTLGVLQRVRTPLVDRFRRYALEARADGRAAGDARAEVPVG